MYRAPGPTRHTHIHALHKQMENQRRAGLKPKPDSRFSPKTATAPVRQDSGASWRSIFLRSSISSGQKWESAFQRVDDRARKNVPGRSTPGGGTPRAVRSRGPPSGNTKHKYIVRISRRSQARSAYRGRMHFFHTSTSCDRIAQSARHTHCSRAKVGKELSIKPCANLIPC